MFQFSDGCCVPIYVHQEPQYLSNGVLQSKGRLSGRVQPEAGLDFSDLSLQTLSFSSQGIFYIPVLEVVNVVPTPLCSALLQLEKKTHFLPG